MNGPCATLSIMQKLNAPNQSSCNILERSESFRIKLVLCEVLTHVDITTVKSGPESDTSIMHRIMVTYSTWCCWHLHIKDLVPWWSFNEQHVKMPFYLTTALILLIRDFSWLWITLESFGVVCLGQQHLLQRQNSIHIFSYCLIVKQYYSKSYSKPCDIWSQ